MSDDLVRKVADALRRNDNRLYDDRTGRAERLASVAVAALGNPHERVAELEAEVAQLKELTDTLVLAASESMDTFAQLPDKHREWIAAWLRGNALEAGDVRWSPYPLGMVQRWVERAEDSESRVQQLLRDLKAIEEYADAGLHDVRDIRTVTTLRTSLQRIRESARQAQEAKS